MNYKFFFIIGALALSVGAYADLSSNPSPNTNNNDIGNSADANTLSGETTSNFSPKDVCKNLVQSEKTNAPDSQFDNWVFQGTKSKVHAKNMIKHDISSDTDCNSETLAGNHAFVVTKSNGQDKLIPFVKQDNMWKLDLQAYRTIYRMDMRMPASQPMMSK